MSTPTTRRLLAEYASAHPDRVAFATLDAADVATNLSTTLPWEDVYTGLALSEAAHGADLAYVHVGCEVYSDEWGFFAAPSTLIWHMRSKIASRIRELQAWSEARHCAPPGRSSSWRDPTSSNRASTA